MTREKNTVLIRGFIVSCFFIILFVSTVFADTRDIYIGDPITLEIKSQTLTEEELKNALEKFEILDIKSIEEGYRVTLTSFDTGKKSVDVEENEIIITIASMLEEVDRKDIYEVDCTQTLKSSTVKKSLKFGLLVICALFFAVSGVLLLIIKLKEKKQKTKPPYIRFNKSLENLDLNRETALEEMTKLFKVYIEELFNSEIMGKTSKEIMSQIQWNKRRNEYKQSIERWLVKCDYYKFGGIQVDLNQKEQLKKELYELTAFIHEREEVDSCN